MNYSNFEPWYTKTAWIIALYDRAFNSCTNVNLFEKQVVPIKKVLSWSGYLHSVRNKIIKRLEKYLKNTKKHNTLKQQDITTIFCRTLYVWIQGETMIKNLVSQLKRHLHKPFKLKNIYRMKKMSYYCNKKDKVPKYLKSHIGYEFFCPACNNTYIGKTDWNFDTCVQKHTNSYRVTGLQSLVRIWTF